MSINWHIGRHNCSIYSWDWLSKFLPHFGRSYSISILSLPHCQQFRHGYERFHSLLGDFMPHFLSDIASPWHRSDTGVVKPISVDSEHRLANTSGCLIIWNIVMAWKPTELEGQPNIFQNCHRFNGKRHRTFNSLLLFANKSMAFLIAKFSAWNTLHYVAKFVGFTYTKNITEDPSTCPIFHIKIVSIVMFLDVTVIYVDVK